MTLSTWLIEHEAAVRLLSFVLVLALLSLAQRLWPTRNDGRWQPRQAVNLALSLLGALTLRLLFPVLAVALAMTLQPHGIGLFNLLHWPAWLEITLAVGLLDLAIYWQHRLFHAVPWLWRLHRVHHSDTAFDVTTGVRFHPLEIALSMLIKLGLVALLGPAALAVILFELLLSLGSLFTHSDFSLPPGLDRGLRYLLVTPSMHRIHHSTRRQETDSNFGFHLVWWDRLFGSYRAQPASPEAKMPIGLENWRSTRDQSLLALLLQPLQQPDTSHRNENPPHA